MVGDDDVDAGGAGGRHLLDGGDRAVDGDEQRGAASRQPLHGGARQAVAVVDAAGEKPSDVGAEAAQGPHHDRRRAHAVDVVVAVDDDPPAGGDVGVDRGQRRVDAGERAGVVALVSGQEVPGEPRVAEPPANEHLREDVADPELALERQRLPERVGGRIEPRVRRRGRCIAGRIPDRAQGRRRRRGRLGSEKCRCLRHGASVGTRSDRPAGPTPPPHSRSAARGTASGCSRAGAAAPAAARRTSPGSVRRSSPARGGDRP